MLLIVCLPTDVSDWLVEIPVFLRSVVVLLCSGGARAFAHRRVSVERRLFICCVYKLACF